MWKGALLLLVMAVVAGSRMTVAPGAAANDDNTNQSILITPPEATAAASSASSFHQASLGGTLALPRQPDGHFYSDAEVNGTTLHFVIDTGASIVALTRADAERAGLTVDPDKFTVVGEGASGPVHGQMVTLHEVNIGDHRIGDVQAMILADGGQSLLGQNLLRQFQSVAIENDEMMLR